MIVIQQKRRHFGAMVLWRRWRGHDPHNIKTFIEAEE
jgi:hypothetical protein